MTATCYAQFHSPHSSRNLERFAARLSASVPDLEPEIVSANGLPMLRVPMAPDDLMAIAFDIAMESCLADEIDLRLRVCTQGTIRAQLEGIRSGHARGNLAFATREDLAALVERVDDVTSLLAASMDAHMTREAFSDAMANGSDVPESVFIDCSPLATREGKLPAASWPVVRLMRALVALSEPELPAVLVTTELKLMRHVQEIGARCIAPDDLVKLLA